MRRGIGILGALAIVLLAGPARAYEDKLTLGAQAGYGLVAANGDLPRHGALLGLEASVGLDDIWSVRGHLTYGYHPGDDTLHVAVLGAEILYLLDVLQVVPYFGIGIDGLGTVYQGSAGVELGAHATLGVEYFLTRETLVGLDIRPHVLPLAIERELLEPVYITGTARFSLVFDL